jgi:hypothetical protein
MNNWNMKTLCEIETKMSISEAGEFKPGQKKDGSLKWNVFVTGVPKMCESKIAMIIWVATEPSRFFNVMFYLTKLEP